MTGVFTFSLVKLNKDLSELKSISNSYLIQPLKYLILL